MKRYAGRRFEVPYLERTTSEVLSDLKPRKLARSGLGAARILEASDLVKFAKLMPEPAQAEESSRSLFPGSEDAPVPASSSEPERAIA
jgi:hypothetical protein